MTSGERRSARSGAGLLVILPTYNEHRTLQRIVTEVLEQVPLAHVLVIDDASSDGTGELADALAAADRRVRVHHREGKFGLGTAYAQGFRYALEQGYRAVCQMDADGSHLPEDLPRLLRASRGESDDTGEPGDGGEPRDAGLVIGARWIPGGRIVNWPRYRRWISRTGTRVARLALRSRLRDITSGYRIIDTAWLDRIDISRIASQGYGFQVETAWTLERLGCPTAEVPITFVERADGKSKMTFGIIVEAFCRVLGWGWQLRFAPHRLP